jgi:3-oxoacyl-(acyl-carrier-protein) synthase
MDFVKWGLIRTGLSQSFGFDGHNAVLILREYQ